MAYLNHLNQQHQYHHAAAPSFQHNHQQQQMNNNGMMMMMTETEEDRREAAAAEELLDSDSRHEMLLPIDFMPCPNTVIVGRGKKVAQHPGNVRFRELVKQELTEYSAATTKAHKSSIIVRVLTGVRNKSQYAFVKQNLTTHRWYRVEETAQRITTAQAFRDALKDNYKSSRAFKKLKREEEKAANCDEKAKEKKEKKKATKEKKKAAATSKSLSPKRPTQTAAAAPPKPKVDIAALMAKRKEEAAKAAKAAGAETSATKPQSMDELRAMLEQQQTALVSGNFSWWDPKAVTKMEEDKKMPPPTAIPSTSVSSCSSLLWSNHSKWSNHSRKEKPRNRNHHDVSNHSILALSNHSLMTISGHSTRSNSTFNGLVSKYAPSTNADMVGNPFEPTPIPACVQEDGGAMDMDIDEDETPKTYVPRSGTTYDEGIALGLGNLSDHSLMSNMSSIHSVKGYTPEEIFADTSMHGSSRHQNGANGGRDSQHQRSGYPSSRYRHVNFGPPMSA